MSTTPAILTFRTDGTARGLYTDEIPLRELGRLTCRRVSRIEFDARSQLWEVRPAGRKGSVLFRHASRAACVDWERKAFA